MAAVSNLGAAVNWTGSAWAAANTYAFGRLAWDPTLDSIQVMAEWSNLTWPPAAQEATQSMLSDSWTVYEKVSSPLGIGLQCGTGGSTKCPKGGTETDDSHYWMCPEQRYEYSHADRTGIGYDRSRTGTNYTGQYPASLASMLDGVESCPEELLLFFHHVPYNHTLLSGQTVIERILSDHESGVEQMSGFVAKWQGLQGLVDEARFRGVLEKLQEQHQDACTFRDRISSYYAGLAGVRWAPPGCHLPAAHSTVTPGGSEGY